MLSGREKNVTSTSLRQAGRGLAESQGRRFRQGQAWLPLTVSLPVVKQCWGASGPCFSGSAEWIGPKTGF